MNTGIFVGGLLVGALVIGAWTHWTLPAEARAPIPHTAPAAPPPPKPRPAPVLLAQVDLRDLAALSLWHRGLSGVLAYQLADEFVAARGPTTPATSQ